MISQGNIVPESEQYKNWFIGDFREEISPFKTDKFEMKWSNREKGYFAPAKEEGSVEEKNTLGILVRGKLKINFIDENREITLENEADYYFSNPTTRHSIEALEDSLIVTLRW